MNNFKMDKRKTRYSLEKTNLPSLRGLLYLFTDFFTYSVHCKLNVTLTLLVIKLIQEAHLTISAIKVLILTSFVYISKTTT